MIVLTKINNFSQIMCIDDYQFRHFSGLNSKEWRRFIFINEDDIEKAFLVNISQFQEEEKVALDKIIVHLSNKGLPICGRSFHWLKHNVCIESGSYCKVPFWTLADKEIIFHSIKTIEQSENINFSGFSEISCMEG